MAFFGNGFLHETHNYRSPGPTSGPFAPNWPATSSQPASGAPRQSNQTQPGTAYGRVEHRTNTTSPTELANIQMQNSVDYRPANCSKPQQSGTRRALRTPHSTLYLAISPGSTPKSAFAPFPAHSKPISNEFPRSQFKNTRGRLLAPMKFNSTPHSRC